MKYYILAATLSLAFLAAPVFANGENNGNGCRNRCGDTTNNTTNKGGKGGTGIGIGIGKGGSARAYGGDAESKSYSNSKSYSGAYSGSAAGALSKGEYENDVTVEDNSVMTYEEKYQAPSMVAPGIDTSQVNVECPLFVQDGWSAGASGPGAGLTAGATDAEAIPTCFALLAAKNSTGEAKVLADTAFYCLSFEAAGVDNSECDGWRDAVRGGPAPTVRNPEVREGR